MIQVTCGACGASQQVADADVPPGGKTITCASCKSRIAVPGAKPTALGAALPDLPAPRRPSPLANAGATRPIPKSALAGVEDLPAPKPAGKPTLSEIPRDLAATSPASTSPRPGDGAGDLLAPKRNPAPVIPPPMPAVSASQPDLVAPKRAPSAIPSIPKIPTPGAAPPKGTAMGLPPTRSPAPARPAGDIDLDDLLAPTSRSGVSDLPSPKRGGAEDLPAPKRPPPSMDLPAPKRPGEVSDLLQPKAGAVMPDLPAPKGFFDDLPQPARPGQQAQSAQGSSDLPAPKGFFDDLPQPAKSRPELPAPKGFFDDIPQVARNQTAPPQPSMNQTGLPQVARNQTAPPQSASAPRPATQTARPAAQTARPAPFDPGNRQHTPSAPPPTADDLFNDLTPPPVMAVPPALDLDDLDLGPPGDAAPGRSKSPSASGTRSLQAGGSRPGAASTPPPASGTRSTEDSDVDGKPLPMLDLGDGGRDFGGVDLPPPAVPPAQTAPTGVSFRGGKPGSNPGPSGSGTHQLSAAAAAGDLALDVDDTKAPPRRKRRTSAPKAKKAAAERAPSSRRTRVVLLVVLLLLAAGGGAFWWWRKHQQAADRAADLAGSLKAARAALDGAAPGHWRIAQAKAQEVLETDPGNAEAAGIAAQAAFAGLFEDSQNAEQRTKVGAAIIKAARGKALSGPDLDKAQGLKLVTDGDPRTALDKYLDPAAKRAPNDGNVALYQGWARLAAADYPGAIDAFDRAAKVLPKRDLPAIVGRGQAKLAMGDLAGARADFVAVLGKDKTHVGAQVGLAASASTPAEIAQREKDLIALLATEEIKKADPRAVAQAWTLAADDARRSNRFDTARDRYRKAIQLAPLETAPLRGLAELELREGKLDAAAELLAKAMKLAPNDLELLLVAGELDIRQDKLPDAEAKIAKVRDAKPASPGTRSRLFLLTGRWYEAQKKVEDALDAYLDAIKIADPSDVAPPLAAASLLGTMAAAEPARAAELRARAAELLAPLEAKAGNEPSIAIALGVGYLAAGDPAKAEDWLRKAIATKPDDIDAHFQLAEALAQQGKLAEALAILRKAFEFDKTRIDIGVQLARRYEEAGRNDDASAMYDQLLAGTDVTLDLRARAGRFYAKVGKTEKARVQGEEILKADDKHPGGLYLKGLGLLADGKNEDARRVLQEAADLDADPDYLDALGRANEMLAGPQMKEEQFRESALRAYTSANQGNPTLVNPLAGMGRIYLWKKQGQKALDVLIPAIKLAPADPAIQYGIGLAHQFLNQPKEAIAWMTRALATRPRPDGYYNVGQMYYDAGDLKGASSALEKAIALGVPAERAGDPTVTWLTDAYWRLAESEKEQHHDAPACKAYRAYVDRNPSDQTKVSGAKHDMLGLCR